MTGETNSRIDPARSACVLIGVDAYTALDPLRAVRNNLTRLEEALTDPGIWGVPRESCQVVSNPATQQELIGPVRKAATAAQDTLIVYYAGHGFIDHSDGGLYLTLPGTEPGEIDGAVPYEWLRRAIRDNGSAKRRVVVLDCCYSGKALDGMSAAGTLQVTALMNDVEGSYVVAASAANRLALSPRGEECTAFTGELVNILGHGIPGDPEVLPLGRVFHHVRTSLQRKRRPQPELQDRNGIGSLLFVKNRQHVAQAVPPPSGGTPTAPGRRRRGYLVSAAVAVVAALTTAGALILWPPEKAAGPCSKTASLLSVSDALGRVDDPKYQRARLDGLSAIALDGPAHAWVLADNAPGRMFHVALGTPDRLDPDPESGGGIRTLRRKDGTPYKQGFDGEGLVVEKGTDTVLISAERDSAIHRFRIADGKELGTLPVPGPWRNIPSGGRADGNRNVESLTATSDGRHLYTGLEGPLAGDGDSAGRNLLRIQRYTGSPGGSYAFDGQYAYEADAGAYLAELVAVDTDRLLALERTYAAGMGNRIRVYDVTLTGMTDVSKVTYLTDELPDTFATEKKRLVLDLVDCPSGDLKAPEGQTQPNPLLDNVEGMALGGRLTEGEHRGRRLLYLISDNNSNPKQVTRLYALSVSLK
ncbi:esterase-like activity of phytase family protein [Streptomyces sp. NBC_00878]|uniref:caspase, EACC1-associated type n=1 Tax=Streptomyces sp. NBC_00878 TaxID=2975854 RepID=UPI002259B7A6|nr:esterase-like activity of phytase family protein [Streptomyces sp. NBC_00878]MCX4906534.1 esterase-like activity of phytase family protein [Streptomyces sp. NBC_00878]